MTFLNPLILWGLPLVFLPVLIHLFNRLRHRKLPWAAMMFLRVANRKSTRYAKLRQWLVLLFRMLAVFMLLFALSRPLGGSWMGGMMSGKPDVVVVLLDRSPSMDGRVDGESRLEKSRELILKGIEKFDDGTRIAFMDGTSTYVQEVESLEALKNMMKGGVNDTASDLASQLETAQKWFETETPGTGEIWIASDLQESNWDPASKERWKQLASNFEGLPQKVRVRLLAMDEPLASNNSVRVQEVQLHDEGEQAELQLEVEVLRDQSEGAELIVPVTIHLGTESRTVDLDFKLEGTRHTQYVKLPIDNPAQGGWGWVEIPDDDNSRDNRSYFVYGSHGRASTAVTAEDSYVSRFLQMAAAPNPANINQVSQAIPVVGRAEAEWSGHAMVLWQGALPEGDVAKALLAYADSGGMVVCFPGQVESDTEFAGIRWGGLHATQTEQGRDYPSWREMVAAQGEADHLGPRVVSWEEGEGPLARTEEGYSLPIDSLYFSQRRSIEGDGIVLASIARDSNPERKAEPFMVRKVRGKGQIIFIGTTPSDQWSSLNFSIVMPIMLQRMVTAGAAAGSGRFSSDRMLSAGDDPSRTGERWVSVGGEEGESRDYNTEAGVYRLGIRVVAVNRPEREDLAPSLGGDKAVALFGEMPVALFSEKREGTAGDPKEIWKWFLALMAVALLVEGFLILPKSTDERVVISRPTTGKVTAEAK
ncbi:MAG: BatA domain-containing protein [Verrucomicrobia subdivision 3 bacterium]|nr:BatA domain-containing protein [Limisphaerales bacterium]